MSKGDQRVDVAKRKLVYRLPRADATSVRRDLEFRASDSGALALDIYRPPDSEDATRLPAVIFVSGYPDSGLEDMLDLAGSTSVADASKTFGFANPCAGRSLDDLPNDLPLFIVKAGRDETPHLNGTIDRFMAEASIHNLPVTFVNHSSAPHAFDLMHDSETSREVIRQILAFMQFHLLA